MAYQPLISVSIDLSGVEFNPGDTYTLCSTCKLNLRIAMLLASTNPVDFYTTNTDSHPLFNVACSGLDDSLIELDPADGVIPGRMLVRDAYNDYSVTISGSGSGQTDAVISCQLLYEFANGVTESFEFSLHMLAHQDDDLDMYPVFNLASIAGPPTSYNNIFLEYGTVLADN